MASPPSAPALDRWLAAASRRAACAAHAVRPSLTINGLPGTVAPDFARNLADYLSTVDDLAEEGWRAFDAPLLEDLATQPLQILGGRALVPRESCGGCTCPGDDCGTRKKRTAAASLVLQVLRGGNAVLQIPGGCLFPDDATRAFHVWLHADDSLRLERLKAWGMAPDNAGPEELTRADNLHQRWIRDARGSVPESPLCGGCHLTINLSHMAAAPLVPIVADSMLEWAAAAVRDSQDLRGLSQRTRSQPRSTVLPFPPSGRLSAT